MFVFWYSRPPVPLDSRASITIGSETFEIEATDLQAIETLGSGAYGVVEKMRHRPSDTVMAVKVDLSCSFHHHFEINIFTSANIGAWFFTLKDKFSFPRVICSFQVFTSHFHSGPLNSHSASATNNILHAPYLSSALISHSSTQVM